MTDQVRRIRRVPFLRGLPFFKVRRGGGVVCPCVFPVNSFDKDLTRDHWCVTLLVLECNVVRDMSPFRRVPVVGYVSRRVRLRRPVVISIANRVVSILRPSRSTPSSSVSVFVQLLPVGGPASFSIDVCRVEGEDIYFVLSKKICRVRT